MRYLFKIFLVVLALHLMALTGPVRAQEAASIWDSISIDIFHEHNPFKPKFPEDEETEKVISKEPKPDKIKKPEKSLWDRIKEIPPEIKKATEAKLPKKPKPQRPPPELVITGLIWNTDRPQAIVNGQIVDIGDTIESTKIVAIRKTGIEISFDGRTITITP
jgi:outer membrane biosynthesis protein TonB